MKKISGFTIIELMIVVMIAAIGIALAVPSFSAMIERKQLGGATEAVFQHLQRAKSQAVKRSKPILVDFYVNGADGTDWAVGFTDKMTGCDAEDIAGPDMCTVDENNDIAGGTDLVMRVASSDFSNITMTKAVNFAPPAVVPTGGCVTTSTDQGCFDFLRGLARTGQYEFDSANNNYQLMVQVTMLGQINVCRPTDKKKMPGYKDC